MNIQKNIVQLTGRFVFASHREFNQAFDRALQADDQIIVIDVSSVSYIDSAALGMLLLARNRAQAVEKSITIRGASGTVLQVLQIANFARLFVLD